MPVQKQLRSCARNVTREGGEASVDVIFTIMNQAWGIMRDKDVDCGKGRHCLLNFILVKEVIAPGLVFP